MFCQAYLFICFIFRYFEIRSFAIMIAGKYQIVYKK